MRIAALTNVADDSRTMLSSGLAAQWMQPLQVRTNDVSVISVLPITFYPKWPPSSHFQHAKLPPSFFEERLARARNWDAEYEHPVVSDVENGLQRRRLRPLCILRGTSCRCGVTQRIWIDARVSGKPASMLYHA